MVVRLQTPSSPSSPSPPSPSAKAFASNRFFFLSAPASPTRELVEDADFSLIATPEETDDFAFHVGHAIHPPPVSAEELFDGGKIRSMIVPTYPTYEPLSQTREVVSPPAWRPVSESKEKKGFWSTFTPIWKKPSNPRVESVERGRSRRGSTRESRARSLSPIRVSEYPWEDEKKLAAEKPTMQAAAAPAPSTMSRRWKLKDLLLFRSASEGRGADKDPMRKLTAMYNRQQEEMKSSSFGSVSKRGRVSAHERHYAMNRAVSDDMKKKTYLPYKQGILGGFQGFVG